MTARNQISLITGMVYAVLIFNITIVAYIYLFKTGDVDTVFSWLAAPLVMGVYPANRTKIVFGNASSPLIERKLVLSPENFQVANFHTGDDSPATRAI